MQGYDESIFDNVNQHGNLLKEDVETFIDNMQADELDQEREYREMEAMYLANQLEV